VGQIAQNARALGAPWESVSTPFLFFEGDRAAAHVGVIELSLVVLGKIVKVGSLHGVATHPDFRRRGAYRRLMAEVLQYCADRYETQILTTEHPEYFTPFGFRVVPEYVFTVQGDTSDGTEGFRVLNTQVADDIALLHRLLDTREPVSQKVGVLNGKAVFCFNEGSRPLHYAADLDAIVCLELEGTKLTLFDIVGPTIPPLAAIRARIPRRVEQVAVCFSPDRLGVEAEANAYVLDHDGPSYFMVRGPFAAEGRAFTLPRSART
jgi:GNAT superfamily N-acetyltransferase